MFPDLLPDPGGDHDVHLLDADPGPDVAALPHRPPSLLLPDRVLAPLTSLQPRNKNKLHKEKYLVHCSSIECTVIKLEKGIGAINFLLTLHLVLVFHFLLWE